MITIDGIQYPNAVVTVVTNQQSVPPVVPPAVPPVQPPVAPPIIVPAPTGPSDYEWNLNEVQLVPVPPLVGSGDYGASVSFIADATRYPSGFRIGGVNEDNTTGAQDYVLSAAPHDFSPLNGNPAAFKQGAGTTMGPMYFCFGTPTRPYEIQVAHGQRYFLNFRTYAEPRGRCSSQFVCYSR